MIQMYDIELLKNQLEEIYSKIPNFDCYHCHKCCGPIIWFKTEDILMNEYMKNNKIDEMLNHPIQRRTLLRPERQLPSGQPFLH
jgi:hypothetical protein